ncbi:outer membrane lipoprotein-sorting protein [Halovivax cerinus]|uniref:DUF4367 domain-containing protein n=1 Tax=Halovivax cerinus TaxID=1487865 RepID=A0ABD5NMC0_9EURY|nr:DUF4367 domain-containing protein [Halovivax cerinus]
MVFRRTLLVCTVTALLVSAGCLGAFPPDDASETEPGTDPLDAAELVERSQSLNVTSASYHATVTTSVSDGTKTGSTTYEVWRRSLFEERQEVVDADQEPIDPDVMVNDGSSIWLSDDGTDRIVRMETSSIPSQLTTYRQQFNAIDFDAMAAERVGTDTVADRSVTIVELTGSEPESPSDDVTLWIDDETGVPLKQEMAKPGYPGLTMTITYESFTPDAEIADDRFTFDPPADVEVLDYDELPTETHDDVDSADETVPFDLPDPTVPEAYSHNRTITSQTLQGWMASLQYVDESADQLTLLVTDEPSGPSTDMGGEPVDLGSVEARQTSVDSLNRTSLTWTAGELTYWISGYTDEETLRSVAESIVE